MIDMIERCDFTKEMWKKKSEMDLMFNALFLKQEFRTFIVAKRGYCPADLNFDTVFEDDGTINLLCCMKHYGWDSLSNQGQEFSDLGDYTTECFKNDEGQKYWPLMCEYIIAKDKKLTAILDELDCIIHY